MKKPDVPHMPAQQKPFFNSLIQTKPSVAPISKQPRQVIARQCLPDSEGSLWYRTRREAQQRMRALIRSGQCTAERCSVEQFDPPGTVTTGFRVNICTADPPAAATSTTTPPAAGTGTSTTPPPPASATPPATGGAVETATGTATSTTTATTAGSSPATPPASGGNVCLTFDDGPQAGTSGVLDELLSAGIHGTFFLTGTNMDDTTALTALQRALVLRMVNEGHRIGNHTFSHAIATRSAYESAYGTLIDPAQADDPRQAAAFAAEQETNRQHFATLLGADFPGFNIARLPGDGRTFRSLTSRLPPLGMEHVGWQFEIANSRIFRHLTNHDWQGITNVDASAAGLPGSGNIILFHDRHWAGANQARLASVIRKLRTEGFTFGTINASGQCANP